MPHHKSAEKRMRTNERDRKRNTAVKTQVRSVVRDMREQAAAENAPERLRKAQSVLDNAVRKGILHKNTVNRKKSRLAKLVNKSKTPAASPAPTHP